MRAIPKIYDKENGQWVELMAKPIAEEVVNIMKDDWLKYKGQLDYWCFKYQDISLLVFVDTFDLGTYKKEDLEETFKQYINNLGSENSFRVSEFINYCKDQSIVIPKVFDVNIKALLFGGIVKNENENINYIIDTRISDTIAGEFEGEVTVSYIYNGHAITDKQYHFINLTESDEADQ